MEVERVGEPADSAAGVGEHVGGGDGETHKKADVMYGAALTSPTIQRLRLQLGSQMSISCGKERFAPPEPVLSQPILS